ncbi:hypothetical protein ANCDUO_05777 [Ancylostoma duodenale]|uniref:Uncharacterized protein n=1 Tax=Ancylostoma duodenale TaxID=51022 RepID=A0A0C2D3B7_9BILA|nr:hypothetical protein ANCDUO_05777 [Ancylostoma duodenale]
MDDLYALVALDATNSVLHWMVVDIPAQELASAPNGITTRSIQAALRTTPQGTLLGDRVLRPTLLVPCHKQCDEFER